MTATTICAEAARRSASDDDLATVPAIRDDAGEELHGGLSQRLCGHHEPGERWTIGELEHAEDECHRRHRAAEGRDQLGQKEAAEVRVGELPGRRRRRRARERFRLSGESECSRGSSWSGPAAVQRPDEKTVRFPPSYAEGPARFTSPAFSAKRCSRMRSTVSTIVTVRASSSTLTRSPGAPCRRGS